MRLKKIEYLWASLRLGMGWIFLWSFFDKLFGLGFSTASDKSWLLGNSPTTGFLTFAVKGPFASIYASLAGSVFVDWLFMLGLLGVGAALMLGVSVRLASYVGILILLLIYAAGFIPPEHNPFLDEHIIYSIVLVGLAMTNSGQWIGLGKWWSRTKLVKRYPILE